MSESWSNNVAGVRLKTLVKWDSTTKNGPIIFQDLLFNKTFFNDWLLPWLIDTTWDLL